MDKLDKKAIDAYRKQATETITRAVDTGPKATPERLHGTLKALLAVAVVVHLKISGLPVTRRTVDAASTAAADAIRQSVDGEE